jgi:hypothetical protein
MAFFECPALEFARSYFRNIMGQDRAYGLINGNRFHGRTAVFMHIVAHGNLP